MPHSVFFSFNINLAKEIFFFYLHMHDEISLVLLTHVIGNILST